MIKAKRELRKVKTVLKKMKINRRIKTKKIKRNNKLNKIKKKKLKKKNQNNIKIKQKLKNLSKHIMKYKKITKIKIALPPLHPRKVRIRRRMIMTKTLKLKINHQSQ